MGAAPKRRRWGWPFYALAAIIGSCLLLIVVWLGIAVTQSRRFSEAEAYWRVKSAALVSQRATVEEVKQAIRDEGLEPFDDPVAEYTPRRRVGASIHGLETATPFPRTLTASILFSSDGVAEDYEISVTARAL